MNCWALDCDEPGSDRFVTKPIGSFSLSGNQLKLVATKVVLCDRHWQAHREAG